ncbi:zinc finger BED domain-containing protein RICESLEEPER 2 [Tanacetum coccineum]
MKENFKKYFKELPPIITCAAALNPTLKGSAVETLIANISYALVQASTGASESNFSISGRVISQRRTKITQLAMEVCICLKYHIDSMERIQNISPLEGDMLRVEEEIHEEEIAMGLSVSLATQELNEENELRNQDDSFKTQRRQRPYLCYSFNVTDKDDAFL